MAHLPEKNDWKTCSTLTKAKSFCWKLDFKPDGEVKLMHIRRQFENAVKEERKEITEQELYEVQIYVQKHPKTSLANNVEKLRLRTEGEGLGKFLYEQFGWSTTDAQLASHIAALFVKSKAWKIVDGNRKTKRGMQFEVHPDGTDWLKCLRNFYEKSPDCTMTN